MKELEKFRNYWDDWHEEWKRRVSAIPVDINLPVKGWPLPKIKNNEIDTWNYFPEPYWGGSSNEIYGVFLSINPGKPLPHHLINLKSRQNNKTQEDIRINNLYFPPNKEYSEIIVNISENEDNNKTIIWMKQRIEWLKQVIPGLKSKVEMKTVLLADLIPWHSEKKSIISEYFRNDTSVNQIIERVLFPLIDISRTVTGPMKNKIIVRGTTLLEILNKSNMLENLERNMNVTISDQQLYVILQRNENEKLSKFISLLTTISISGTIFYIFSGGSSMNLPDPDYEAFSINKERNESVSSVTPLRDLMIS